jgi:hypothetical protein
MNEQQAHIFDKCLARSHRNNTGKDRSKSRGGQEYKITETSVNPWRPASIGDPHVINYCHRPTIVGRKVRGRLRRLSEKELQNR